MTTFTAQHAGIDITYDERRNVWVFELRGRERSAESLQKAKEAIDKPEPKERKPFTRIEAWYKKSYGEFEDAAVTSIAENSGYGSGPYVWITVGKNRSKESTLYVYPKNAHNDALVAEWKELNKQMEALRGKQDRVNQQMKRLEIPKESTQ